MDVAFDVELLGFETAEIDLVLDDAREAAAAQRKVSLRVNGAAKEMTLLDATLFKTFETANAGSPHAQRLVFQRADRVEAKERALIDHDVEAWRNYVDTTRRLIANAKNKGEAEPDIILHPDDVKIDPVHGVSFTGPTTREQAEACRKNCRLRDALLLQTTLERRLHKGDPEGPDAPGSGLKLAMLIDHFLPERMRLKKGEAAMLMIDHDRIPKRELLKRVTAAWKEVGYPRQRGSTLPSIEAFEHLFGFMLRIHNDWQKVDFDEASYPDLLDAAIRDYQA